MKKSFTKAESFYIEQHADKLTAKEIAKDLGMTAARVQRHLDLTKVEATPPAPSAQPATEPPASNLATPIEQPAPGKGFLIDNGKAAIMTPSRAMQDDIDAGTMPEELGGKEKKPDGNQQWQERYSKNIHKTGPAAAGQ